MLNYQMDFLQLVQYIHNQFLVYNHNYLHQQLLTFQIRGRLAFLIHLCHLNQQEQRQIDCLHQHNNFPLPFDKMWQKCQFCKCLQDTLHNFLLILLKCEYLDRIVKGMVIFYIHMIVFYIVYHHNILIHIYNLNLDHLISQQLTYHFYMT